MGGKTAPRRYMKGQNDMWPRYKAAAGSLVHELIGSALLEIRNHDVRSVYIPLQPPDFALQFNFS